MQFKIFAAILIAVISVLFAMQNNVPVTINFLIWNFESSLALVLLLSLALGASVVSLLTMPNAVRQQLLMLRQKRRIEELEEISDIQKRKLSEATQKPHVAAPVAGKKPA